MNTSQGEAAGKEFYNIAFVSSPHYKHQGWLFGRVTTDDNVEVCVCAIRLANNFDRMS